VESVPFSYEVFTKVLQFFCDFLFFNTENFEE
jgi:hypothetical protein